MDDLDWIDDDTVIVLHPNPAEVPLRSGDFTWGATGLWAWLLTVYGGGPVLNRAGLLKAKRDGDFRLRQYLRELKEAGYLKQQVVKDWRTKRVERRQLLVCYSGDAEEHPNVVWENVPSEIPGHDRELRQSNYDDPKVFAKRID